MTVSPEHFEQQLAVLTRVARVVPLADLDVPEPPGDPRPPRVAITFDDGYADNLLFAEPRLRKCNATATVFVPSALIGSSQPFWWDTLAALVHGDHPLPAELSIPIGPRRVRWKRHSQRRSVLFRELQAALKHATPEHRTDALREFAAWAGAATQVDALARPMTIAELRQLDASPVIEIGAHTRSHPSLPLLSLDDQFQEIVGSKNELQQMLGHSLQSFAYPYGDFSAQTPAMVAKAGFSRACSTVPELNFVGADRWLVPRFGVGDWNGASFERHLRREWFA